MITLDIISLQRSVLLQLTRTNSRRNHQMPYLRLPLSPRQVQGRTRGHQDHPRLSPLLDPTHPRSGTVLTTQKSPSEGCTESLDSL